MKASLLEKPAAPLRLLIVDDHAIVRDGLEAMLRVSLAPVEIHTVSSGTEAMRHCASHQPHLVLLDVRMPEGDGFGVLEGLARQFPGIQTLMLSASATEAEVKLARRMGAAGYLSKNADAGDVLHAIRHILGGGTCFSAGPAPAAPARAANISARELDVLRHLGRGLSNQDLARLLGISDATVKAHLRSIYTKLDVADRAEAVSRAYQLGILSVENP